MFSLSIYFPTEFNETMQKSSFGLALMTMYIENVEIVVRTLCINFYFALMFCFSFAPSRTYSQKIEVALCALYLPMDLIKVTHVT